MEIEISLLSLHDPTYDTQYIFWVPTLVLDLPGGLFPSRLLFSKCTNRIL